MTSIHDLQTVMVPVATLHTYFKNPRRGNVPAIVGSLRVNSQYRPIVVNRGTHTGRPDEVLAGNHTLIAAREIEWETIACVYVDVDEDAAARIVAVDNRTSDLAEYDTRLLLELLSELPDLEGTGYDPGDLDELEKALAELEGENWGEGGGQRAEPVNLTERFGVPPFSVLDTRQGYWRRRKAAWLALGIRSEVGRNAEGGDGIVFTSMERRDPQFYRKKEAVEATLGHEISTPEFIERHYTVPDTSITTGTSVFDPVLCEAMYRWHCPPGGVVIDPFAGGSVRGVVAAALGRRYFGGELRAQQVEANREQWDSIFRGGDLLPPTAPPPVWVQGDSRTLIKNFARRPPPADMLFTCPPYADLEVYSDDPADLSNMPYQKFMAGYRDCLREGVDQLRDDSFAVLVVGEVRGKKHHGTYYGFVPDTINTMGKLGLGYYANYVLINMVGSAAMAANRQMIASRKPVHTHQHVLVFVKGDARAAADRCPLDEQLDLPDPDATDGGGEDGEDAADEADN